MESKHDNIYEVMSRRLSLEHILNKYHIFQKTGFKQRTDQGLNASRHCPALSIALGMSGVGSLFKETGITTTLLGRNHSSKLTTFLPRMT